MAFFAASTSSHCCRRYHPDKQFVVADSMSHVAPSLYSAVTFMAVPVSLLFMYQIRKNPKLGASSD